MSAPPDTPPDQIAGAPHPRQAARLFGQGPAEAAFLDAFATGRLHHAWLLSGPRGVGKATLAWRVARFLLATPDPDAEGQGGLFGEAPPPETMSAPDRLDIDPDHPVARRLAAGSDPGLFHITRRVNEKTGRLRDMIVAEDVRRLNRFLSLSATEGGRRVVLIDSADEMNTQAANALLKMLEEPPARTTLLLVSHQPAGLLPTIRSRCRDLRLQPLGEDDMAAALDQAGLPPEAATQAITQLSGGSVGEAVRLVALDGAALYAELTGLAASLPALDRPRALALAQSVAARGAEDRLDLLFALTDLLLARLARTGATGTPPPEAAPGEAETLARLAPDSRAARAWAALAQQVGERARHGRAVNLDPAALVLDTVFKLKDCATA